MRAEVAAPRIRPLLERGQELAALEAVLTAARDGLGGMAVIEGPPGIGKSRLLGATRAMASGFTVLRARGGELEQDFPWGVVRQLFEAEVALADAPRRQALLAGAAATATEPLGLRRDVESWGCGEPGRRVLRRAARVVLARGQPRRRPPRTAVRGRRAVGGCGVAAIPALPRRPGRGAAQRAAPGRVAVHLLATDPGGLPWVAHALRDAAERALARGAPDTAAEFLRRALAEPPLPETLPGLLRLLGRCALLAGDDSGAEHYRAAMEATADPAERAATARELGVIHVPPGGYVEAAATLERAVADARAAGESELAQLTEADLVTAGRLHPATLAATRSRADAIDPDTVEATPAGRCLLGSLALHGIVAGWPLPRVVEVAQRAASGSLPADATTTNTLWDCGFALSVADELPAADDWWQTILAAARAQGSILTFARCSCFLAMTALRGGDLLAAEAHARASLGATAGQRWFLRRMVTATLVERGARDEARAALGAVDGDGELGDFMMINFLLFARGRLRVARGELEAGLDDFHEYGRRPGSAMRDNPALPAWATARSPRHCSSHPAPSRSTSRMPTASSASPPAASSQPRWPAKLRPVVR